MPGVLRSRTYRRLFAAQVVALTGTGLATVALGLLAYRLAGGDAAVVLGTALAVKMVAYVAVAPVAGALAGLVPRRALLVGLDVVRAGVAVALPWADAVWQVYLLIFLLQAASAAFTPTFQAVVPDVLPDERDYTRALTLSRLAYDLESLLSPSLAALALLVVGYENLFFGTAIGFAASAMLVASVGLPGLGARSSFSARGIRIYLGTPRLRGLLAVHLAVSAAGAVVLVGTVVLVRDGLGLGAAEVAVAFAANGTGSLLAALALPRVLDAFPERAVMLRAAWGTGAVLAVGSLVAGSWPGLLVVWFVVGAGGSLVLTPAARLLRRSAQAGDRPGLFAADFALSHACWLACYPVAGWLVTVGGAGLALPVMGAVAVASTAVAGRLWPSPDAEVVEHSHVGLDPDHDHVRDAVPVGGGRRHAHPYRIDDHHPRWPRG